MLKARHTNNGTYHLRSTPKITATRGWRADDATWSASLPLGVCDAEDEGDGGTTADAIEGEVSLSRNVLEELVPAESPDVGGDVAGLGFNRDAIKSDSRGG